MNKHIKLLTMCIIICALFFTVKSCKNPDSFIKEVEDKPLTRSGELSWDYPIKPGMEAWYALETEDQRISVLQVPGSVLASLSSEEVVGLCITFPAFGIFTAWNTPQKSFDIMLERYNILRHLLSRDGVGGFLIAAYKDAGMEGFKTLPYSNEYWSIKLLYIELLLAQKEIIQHMTPDERLELITEARSKYFEKAGNEDFASLPELLFSLRVMVSILDIENYPELMASPNRETITEFINSGWLFAKGLQIGEIGRMTDSYINSKNEIL